MSKYIYLPDQTCFPLSNPYSVHSLVKHLLSAYSVPGARERTRASLCQTSILSLMASWFSLCHRITSVFLHIQLVGHLICSSFITYLTFVFWVQFHFYHFNPRLTWPTVNLLTWAFLPGLCTYNTHTTVKCASFRKNLILRLYQQLPAKVQNE